MHFKKFKIQTAFNSIFYIYIFFTYSQLYLDNINLLSKTLISRIFNKSARLSKAGKHYHNYMFVSWQNITIFTSGF